MISRR